MLMPSLAFWHLLITSEEQCLQKKYARWQALKSVVVGAAASRVVGAAPVAIVSPLDPPRVKLHSRSRMRQYVWSAFTDCG
jgi:hypothetical protein